LSKVLEVKLYPCLSIKYCYKLQISISSSVRSYRCLAV